MENKMTEKMIIKEHKFFYTECPNCGLDTKLCQDEKDIIGDHVCFNCNLPFKLDEFIIKNDLKEIILIHANIIKQLSETIEKKDDIIKIQTKHISRRNIKILNINSELSKLKKDMLQIMIDDRDEIINQVCGKEKDCKEDCEECEYCEDCEDVKIDKSDCKK